MTNWLDPDTTGVRLLLFALMLAGLVMAAAIPRAFEDRALWFALAYVALQTGRSLYMMWALHGHAEANYRNFQRITAWFAVSGLLWIGGALSSPAVMYGLWTAAVIVELAAPSAGFWTPGLGRSVTGDWNIAGGHIAERCGLFVIIGLGESILMTGATFADLPWNSASAVAFAVGVVGSIAMWWIYFNVGAERASRLIAASNDPGALGRLAYTYIHVPIVAGIILAAASDETLLKQSADPLTPGYALTLAGGPAVFLLGCLLFKWVTCGWPPLSHIAGAGLLALLVLAGRDWSVTTFAAAASGVLVLVSVWETQSLRREIAASRSHAETHRPKSAEGG